MFAIRNQVTGMWFGAGGGWVRNPRCVFQPRVEYPTRGTARDVMARWWASDSKWAIQDRTRYQIVAV